MSDQTNDNQLKKSELSPTQINTFELSAVQSILRSLDQDLLLTRVATVECSADQAVASLLDAIGTLPIDARLQFEITLIEELRQK
jgi:hypothetical protein